MTDYACALCGWFIPRRTDSVSWLHEFRGLCSGPEGIILTGVGLNEDPFEQGEPLVAPTDRDGRWDDLDYNSPPEHQFTAMGENDQGLGRYGFLFHEACWSLLETVFLPGAVPCERLFDICRSFPLVRYHEGCISWGHDYAGAIQTNDLNIFPWEHSHEELGEFEPDSIFSTDPYHGGDAKWILTTIPEQPPGELPPSSNAIYRRKDCFSSLPIELLSAIAVEMSTCDFLNARLASRSFWPIFDDYHFWASRFKHGSERPWIFERRDDDKRHNWRWIYRQTQTALLSFPLKNRKRIWGLAHKLLDIVQLRWTELTGSPLVLSADKKMTSRASGYLWKDNQDNPCYSLGEGCRILHRQSVPISPTTAHFSIFSVHLGDRVYICGITITSVEGVVINLGYQSENKSSVEISGEITGFVLAIGYRGIQAIQCVVGGNQKTAWLGCPGEVPHTQCLVMSSRIIAIEAGFDACKLVSLAVCPELPNPIKEVVNDEQLRTSGLWYPEAPGPSLCLNVPTMTQVRDYINFSGYKPFLWTLFGGPGGIYLPHLTHMSADTAVGRINFFYDQDVPPHFKSLGRSTYSNGVHKFPIDGKGGERIIGVEVYRLNLRSPNTPAGGEGTFLGFKVYTNRQRSCLFFYEPRWLQMPGVSSTLTKTPGKTITGLYVCQAEKTTFRDLGVISEALGHE